MAPKKLHLAMVSSPGIGHLLPALLFGHRLVTVHDLRVTVISVTTSTTSPAYSQLLSSYTTNIDLSVIQIPAADISSLVSPDAKVVTRLCVMMRETLPKIRTTISSMDPCPDVLMGDIFANESFVIAEEFGMPKYVFVTGNAWFTSLFAYSPVLDKEVVGQYVDKIEPFEIPGCKSIRPEEVVDPMLDRDDQSYQCYLNQAVGVKLTDGILINTWEELEPQSLEALRSNVILRSILKYNRIYTVGPINKIQEPLGGGLKSEVINWLDKQPNQSVIYVSFGSGGTLSVEQVKELAWGLELSRQRFIWVVRSPTENGSDESFFKPGQLSGSDGPPDFFPDGFLTRTQNMGFVMTSWAPQIDILKHPSVGGFLTHCGWNSTLESITNGVPMIAWPLYAEQNMNAAMLSEELKVAVSSDVLPTKKVVSREEVERMVRVMMGREEGKAMREIVKALKESAEKALSKNGSSFNSICMFIDDCWSRIH